eukprot:TRINITY_DN121679_c0_g1_i1.p1 TRINITY_DN121679_c0_g1~~TRINITY_DN121679_c0_g1_i1.p1  ORF type:complete len:1212 (-),score=255.15 TRINITY_DN121679_c0_g1_i1:56-3691(-)
MGSENAPKEQDSSPAAAQGTFEGFLTTLLADVQRQILSEASRRGIAGDRLPLRAPPHKSSLVPGSVGQEAGSDRRSSSSLRKSVTFDEDYNGVLKSASCEILLPSDILVVPVESDVNGHTADSELVTRLTAHSPALPNGSNNGEVLKAGRSNDRLTLQTVLTQETDAAGELSEAVGKRFSRESAASKASSQGIPGHSDTQSTTMTELDSRYNKSHSLDAEYACVHSLPVDWPQSLKLREDLDRIVPADAQGEVDFVNQFLQMKTPNRGGDRDEALEVDWFEIGKVMSTKISKTVSAAHRQMWTFVCHPSSYPRMFMDVLSLPFLTMDMIMIPFMLSFETMGETQEFSRVFGMLSVSYWSLDMVFGFRTGYFTNGELEMRPQLIMRRYLSTFFVLDLLLVILDATSLAFSLQENADNDTSSSSAKLGRLLKLGRIMRVIGVLRVLRVSERFSRLTEQLAPFGMGAFMVIIQVIKYLTMIAWLNHLLSCVWHAIGRYAASDTGVRWTTNPVVNLPIQKTYMEMSTVFRYTTALHWALAQTALGSMELMPMNSSERVFTIFCYLIGLVVFSTLVSLMSASLVDWTAECREQQKRLQVLRSYLRQTGMNRKLAVTVQKQVLNRMRTPKPINFKDVEVFSFLSLELRRDLRVELCMPHLKHQPIWRFWQQIDDYVMRQFCDSGVDFLTKAPGDTLFLAGDRADGAILLTSGEITYTQRPGSAPVRSESTTTVLDGTWLCEAALFCEWLHMGTAEVSALAHVLHVDAAETVKIWRGQRTFKLFAYEYGRIFTKRVNNSAPPGNPFPTDLHIAGCNFADIVTELPSQLRVLVGLFTLELVELEGDLRGDNSAMRDLTDDVCDEKCLLAMNSHAEIERRVLVTCMEIRNRDRKILCRLGKVSEEFLVSNICCELPGAKQRLSENPEAVALGLLKKELRPFSQNLLCEHVSRTTGTGMSNSSRITTKYSRTIMVCTLNSKAKLWPHKCLKYRPGTEVPVFLRDVFLLTAEQGRRASLFAWLTEGQLQEVQMMDADGGDNLHYLMNSLVINERSYEEANRTFADSGDPLIVMSPGLSMEKIQFQTNEASAVVPTRRRQGMRSLSDQDDPTRSSIAQKSKLYKRERATSTISASGYDKEDSLLEHAENPEDRSAKRNGVSNRKLSEAPSIVTMVSHESKELRVLMDRHQSSGSTASLQSEDKMAYLISMHDRVDSEAELCDL